MLTTIAMRGYRSLREVVVPLRPLTLVTGAGKSRRTAACAARGHRPRRSDRLPGTRGRPGVGFVGRSRTPGRRPSNGYGPRNHQGAARLGDGVIEIDLFKEWGETRVTVQTMLTVPARGAMTFLAFAWS